MNSVNWSVKKKSVLFVTVLSLVSVGFVTAAAVSTQSLLAPFRAGLDFADERSLSRHTHSLAVIVGNAQGRIPGAAVQVEGAALGANGLETSVAAAGVTDLNGRIIFELQEGPYFLRVAWAGGSDREGLNLYEDQRVGAYFDPDGQAYWRHTRHDDLERGENQGTVYVHVDDARYCSADRRSCNPIPSPGAEVRVYWIQDDQRVGLLQTGTTGDGSATHFGLEPGVYELEILYDGKSPTHRFELFGDYMVDAFFDGDDVRIHGSVAREAVAVPG